VRKAASTSSASDEGAYPRVDEEVRLTCPSCGYQTDIVVPMLLDWRDQQSVRNLIQVYPAAACSGCGERVAVPVSVCQLRPGDPVRVLVAVAPDSQSRVGALELALAQHAAGADGRIAGPTAATDPALLVAIADRYSGFALLGMDEPDPGWRDQSGMSRWLAIIRQTFDWPRLQKSLTAFVTAETEADAVAVAAELPELTDPAWEPALRVLGAAFVDAQQEDEAIAAVQSRLRRLNRLRLLADRDSAETATVVQEAIDAALAFHPHDDEAARRQALRHVVEVARVHGDELALLAGLSSLVATLQSAADRTDSDIREGIVAGVELVERATQFLGAEHALTLTAMNDTAMLYLEDRADAASSTREALALLEQARAHARRLGHPLLADLTANIAVALLNTGRINDADEHTRAAELFGEASHLYKLHQPDRPENAIKTLSNLASLQRSSLAGDPAANARSALASFDEVLALDARHRAFGTADRLTVQANRLNALASLAALDPDGVEVRRIRDEIAEIAQQLVRVAPDHPIRVRTLINLGGIALDLAPLLRRQEPGEDVLSTAIGWLTEAAEKTAVLPADHADRVLAVTTLAAAYAMRNGPQDRDRAEGLLTEALQALEQTPPTRLHHTVAANLGRLHLMHGEWSAATRVFADACRYADTVIERANTGAARLAHVAAAGDLYQRLALCHVHNRDARAAVHAVERSRARWMSTTVPEAPIDSDGVDHAIHRLLRKQTALLYTGSCGVGSYAFLLAEGRGSGLWLSSVTTGDLAPLLTRLHGASGVADVAATLDDAAKLLAEPLLDPVSRILDEVGIRELLVVAGGPLAGLPLHAIAGNAGPWLDRAVVRYLVSARVTDRHRRRPARSDGDVIAVANPTGGLPFAEGEITALASLEPQMVTPPPGAGVRGWLLNRLSAARRLHLACHARYEPSDPFASRFILGLDLVVTIEDLEEVRADQLELAVASCCRSGVIDQRSADEFVGLAPALIRAGAAGAVAALWDIEDVSTGVLVALFYAALRDHDDPAEALRVAQLAMRDLTMEELGEGTHPRTIPPWLPAEFVPEIRALALHPELRNPSSRPFPHAAHWAGLLYIGR
jgi:CHAT domain-containing protein/tetratricopeptide (TPR) repeat protein